MADVDARNETKKRNRNRNRKRGEGKERRRRKINIGERDTFSHFSRNTVILLPVDV